MTNLLYIITGLGSGGAEKLLAEVCGALHKQYQITVVFLKEGNTYEDQLRAVEIEPIFVDQNKLGLFGSIMQVRKIIKQKKIRIVHTHLPSADTVGRIAALLCPQVKWIISSIHAQDEWKRVRTLPYAILRTFNRVTVNCFKRVKLIAVSKAVKAHCMEYEYIRGDKITVVYNFVNYEENEKNNHKENMPPLKTPDNFVMVTIARIDPVKGYTTLLNAVKTLCDEGQNILLVALGEGSQRQELETFVQKNGLKQHVRFMGFRKNTYDFLRGADLFVLASTQEGQSLAVLEAFYCGTPVLASDILANSELLGDGKNGVLFRANDTGDLAQKIKEIRENKYDLAAIRENAKAFGQTMSIENHTMQLERIYNE